MPAERASMDDDLILGRYRLTERLAVGGSAEVWRASDEQLGREVAVKRIHPHLIPDEAARKRLVIEARAAAALSHPVVVGIYDVDATGDWPALVMELVDGESLAARITRDGPLAPRDAARVVADVADALFHAHQRGVIHRDVKPGNVLLGSDGRTRLVDFGIAHSLAASTERLTVEGTVIGTLHAMAPEQLAGGPITPRTDLYGLGVVLHEALTGRPPFPATSPVGLADAQRRGPAAIEGVDAALAAVVAGCLAFDPAERPLHAGALAGALRAWSDGDPAPALAMAPAAAVDTAAMTRPVPAASPKAEVAAAPGATRRPRWPWAALALAALAGLVLLGGAAMVIGLPDELTGDDATASPTASTVPTSDPTPEPTPDWLAELLEKVRTECDAATATEVAPELASLEKKEAEELVKALEEQCKEFREGGGNDGGGEGGGNGNGGGNGGGNGRGNDD